MLGVYTSLEMAQDMARKHAGVNLSRWLKSDDGKVWYADHPAPFDYMIQEMEVNGEPALF